MEASYLILFFKAEAEEAEERRMQQVAIMEELLQRRRDMTERLIGMRGTPPTVKITDEGKQVDD